MTHAQTHSSWTERLKQFVPWQTTSQGKRPPTLEGALPVAGHSVEFLRDPMGLIDRGHRSLGEAYHLKLFNVEAAVLTGPEANEAIFRASDEQLSPKEAYKLMTPIFGRGIAYDAEPKVMSEQLSFFFPALRKVRMDTYAAHMTQETQAYTEQWGDEGEVDLAEMMNELTMYVSSRCLLCVEFREKLNREFADLYHDLERGVHPLAYFFPNAPIPTFLRRNRARVRMRELLSVIIAERRRGSVVGEDFLQTLMDANYRDGRKLTDDEITGLLLAIVFAGHHTSAVLATWTGVELLQHPQYLPDILAEQEKVHDNRSDRVTSESLRKIPHLEHAVMEAERLHPPLVLLMRKALQDFHFRDYVIPAGDLIIASPLVSNRSDKVFSNPQVYAPERFAPGREEHKKHPYSMTTFGGGKHICMGLHFAHMQVKAIWSVLLQQFEFELASSSYEPSFEYLVVGPRRPCLLRYKRRDLSKRKSSPKNGGKSKGSATSTAHAA